LIVVDHRPFVGWSAVVPCSFQSLAIDIAADRLGLAERVGHRDVVPAAADRKPGPRRPAMEVVRFAAPVVGAAKQKTHARLSLLAAQAKRIVLVLRRKASVLRTSLAEDVNLLIVAEPRAVDPGF